jgi:hypothetical protein
MTRTSLYAVIGVLAAIAIALGIYIAYQQSQQPSLQIKVDKSGISVDGNG